MRTIRQRVTFGRSLAREFFHVLDLEREMSQIRTNLNRTALIEFAELDFFFASGRLKKDQLRSAAGGMTPNLLQSENVPVEGHCLFQIFDPIARVQEFGDHESF